MHANILSTSEKENSQRKPTNIISRTPNGRYRKYNDRVKRTLSASPFAIKTFARDNLLFNATLVSIYEHVVALNGQGSIYS